MRRGGGFRPEPKRSTVSAMASLSGASVGVGRVPAVGRPARRAAVSRGCRRSRRVSASAAAGAPAGSERVVTVEGEAGFESMLKDAGDALVVLDVSGKSCGPCKMIYPYFCELAETEPDSVFACLTGDASEETKVLVKKMGVKALPHFRFYRNGVLLEKFSGASKDKLREALERSKQASAGDVDAAVAKEAEADALKDVGKGLAERLKGL